MRVAGWTFKAGGAGLAALAAVRKRFDLRPGRAVAVPGGPDGGEARTLRMPGADMHLVMNTFNRLAATACLPGEESDEQIFDLSDYLRHCLEHSVPAEISLDQEIALLGSYLSLTAGFRRWQLDAPVTVQAELRDTTLRAHSLCLVAQALLCAWSPESPGRWALPVTVSVARGRSGIAMDLVLQPLSPQPPARLHRVHAELRLLCQAMSQQGAHWSYRVRAARRHVGDARVAVDVLIR